MVAHPRRAALICLVALTIVVGVRVVAHEVAHRPPPNDPATLDRLRSRFAPSGWAASLVGAHWDTPDTLRVALSGDDRNLALAACSDLTGVVQVRTSTGPDGVTRTVTSGDGTLFVTDRSNTILVSNILNLNSGCRWRRG